MRFLDWTGQFGKLSLQIDIWIDRRPISGSVWVTGNRIELNQLNQVKLPNNKNPKQTKSEDGFANLVDWAISLMGLTRCY